MSAPTPFSSLIGPLRYASQNDFARLGQVRGLRAVLETALRAAEQAGGDFARQALALRSELERIEHPSLDVRRQSITRVMSLVEGQGTVTAPRGQDPKPRAPLLGPAVIDPPKSTATKPKAAKPPAAANPKATKPTKKKPTEKPPEPEARILSISPREGPLGLPLKSLGGRMNPRLVGTLNKKGIRKVGDVLFLLPRAYEDRRRIQTIAELRPGERGSFIGTVHTAGEVPSRGGRKLFRVVLGDRTGTLSLTYFQSGPWMKQRFPLGKKLLVSGELRASYTGREMAHPEVEPADDLDTSSIHFGRIVPIYPGFERHEQRAFRDLAYKVQAELASSIEEPLPESLRKKLGLRGLGEALSAIHFPAPDESLAKLNNHESPAHQRLAFDELFFLQLGMALKRQGVKIEPGVAFDASPERIEKAEKLLPFTLTRAQRRAVEDIVTDMRRAAPMHRLLQGDVGSGKTAVAAVSAALALLDGYQVALMAPTELLASQHKRTLSKMFEPLGVEVAQVSSGGPARERALIRARLASGELRAAVGTHALIEDATEFEKLGLVIIDEQHRFGVLQRQRLMSKGTRPDVLVMTATPIPRTLAMTLYADLDLSVIDELPPGRTPIVTRKFWGSQRARVYEAVAQELALGHQCYVVYPLVEASEKSDLADATQGAQTLAAAFPQARVGLIHGRMKQEEKDAVMTAFRANELQILVATTVIEVGVDVPNASVMLVEHAERFGLSQLHQLRGRVGRGAAKSYCFLVATGGVGDEAAERLAVMEESTDGFVIAQKDLELRGPGEFLGIRQSGIPELAVANLARDQALLATALREARAIVELDPQLREPDHIRLVRALEERWEGRLALARVG